jgi:hypothetical protein
MWAFPPGGVPPDVVGPDVVPIPKDPVEPVATPNRRADGDATATESPGVSPEVSPTATATVRTHRDPNRNPGPQARDRAFRASRNTKPAA